MHILQPKHIKLSHQEGEKIVSELNISLAQLPKISIKDPALPEGCQISDIIKIERVIDGKKTFFYRVVTV